MPVRPSHSTSDSAITVAVPTITGVIIMAGVRMAVTSMAGRTITAAGSTAADATERTQKTICISHRILSHGTCNMILVINTGEHA